MGILNEVSGCKREMKRDEPVSRESSKSAGEEGVDSFPVLSNLPYLDARPKVFFLRTSSGARRRAERPPGECVREIERPGDEARKELHLDQARGGFQYMNSAGHGTSEVSGNCTLRGGSCRSLCV